MTAVGDRVQVPSRKVGGAPREGVVTGVSGLLLRVRWSTGEESTVAPSMGSLEIVPKGPVAASKQAKKAVKPSRGATRSQAAEKPAETKQSRQATAARTKRAPKKGGK